MENKTNKESLWKELLPLTVIIIFVIILASIGTIHHDGNLFHWLRDFMSVFFIVFGILKLIKWKAFVSAYEVYDLIAMRSKIYAFMYPVIEIGLGILLFVNIFPLYVNIFITIIMSIGALGVYLKLRKGEEIPCACLGTVFKVPMTWVTLLEDLVMALMAGFMVAVMLYNPLIIEGFSFEKFKQMNHGGGEEKGKKGEIFSEHADGLPEIIPTKIIKLKDGDVFEMTAELVQQEVGNRTIKRLAYNRMIPGPIIEVEKDAKITIILKNKLDVDTTLHSHGLRLDDYKFDGVPKEMGGTQENIKPGESFEYQLNFPDAGVFWYHPHIREDYTQELGLYGNFSVVEKDYWNKVSKEEFLILDDFSENNPFFKNKVNHTLQGRYGNIFLINNNSNYKMKVNRYESVRFFVTNTANTKTFDFSIDGQKLKIVGGDIGRGEKEFLADNFIIAPAERIIFEARFDTAGIKNITHRGEKIGEIEVIDTGKIVKQTRFGYNLRNNSEDYSIIRKDFDKFLKQKNDKKLRLTIGMDGQGEIRRGQPHRNTKGELMTLPKFVEIDNERESGGIIWEETVRMNKRSNDGFMEWLIFDDTYGKNVKKNMDIDWKFKKDEFVKIEIFNDPFSAHPIQHPIHFHGQRFIVLTRDGKVEKNLQWKDTSLIKVGEKVEILVQMTNVGVWMSHCHIAEHLQSGMMFNFEVE